MIPVTGGGLFPIGCDNPFVYQLEDDGVRVSFTNLCNYDATVQMVETPDLPGDLPDGASIVASLETRIFQDGTMLVELPQGAEVVVAFEIPDGVNASDLQVLYWDGTAWVTVDGQASSEDGFFEALVDHGGVFILVQS